MTNLLRTCKVFTSLFLLSLPAYLFAAPTTWQGPYGGIYVGGGFGNNHLTTNAGSVTGNSYFTTSADVNVINNAGSWTQNPNTMIAGIQAGHDWAYQQMVYGVALDYGVLPLSSSNTTNATYPDNSNQYSVNTSMRTNWLLTLRGRLGYQAMVHFPSLFYITGGMAITQLKVNNSFSDNSAFSGNASSNTSQNQIGWTGGVGVEVMAYKNISVDAEYLYVKVPSVNTTGIITNADGGFGILPQSLSNPFATTANFHATLFKIGLNYRFDE